MDATTPDLTPTTTTMNQTHRLRVMRSMRKITALLGETAVLESAKSELTPTNKFSFLPLLELLPLPPQRRALSADERPALSIRMPAIDVEDGSPSDRDSLLFSPLSPTSPVLVQNSGFALRHRMAKLTRTLGETVPVELIISTPPPPVKRRRRASTLIVPESALEQQAFAARGLLAVSTAEASAVRVMQIRTEGLEPTSTSSSPTEATSPMGEVNVHPVLAFSPDTLVSPGEWIRPSSRVSSYSRSASSSPVSSEAANNMGDVVHNLRKLRSSKSLAVLGISS
ncbi:hypothetical protein FB45DRAFT_870271 [Roridomyces roridus]|uniref:Uncharacterized protein n=1 Tax=Roridomyces roridus TaxID=1738132 RepID=A0AAD7FJ44_9AGAR|nr:hypothetical protein FB45DRAFT_870271 [Roridomyces roridus]